MLFKRQGVDGRLRALRIQQRTCTQARRCRLPLDVIPGMEYTMNDSERQPRHGVPGGISGYDTMPTDQAEHRCVVGTVSEALENGRRCHRQGIIHHLTHQTKSQPELILESVPARSLLEKGVNITDGGSELLHNMSIDGAGLP